MHKYNNQDHSMLTAMMAVENMHGAAHDVWDVNTDFEYHEEQRIEAPDDTANGTRSGGGSGAGSVATPPAARRASAPSLRASVGA